MQLYIPEGYSPILDVIDTQKAIKQLKDDAEKNIADQLNLRRISAPLFVRADSGLNDNLSGVERPVSFDIAGIDGDVEIVHSLAKWKRLALHRYNFEAGTGLYTDMNAIRRDEDADNIHSVYVDQWDWERVIAKEDRTLEFLYDIVGKIFKALADTEENLHAAYPALKKHISADFLAITASELAKKYPDLSPKEREHAICREYGSVFISQIGGKLEDGSPSHDGRAPDYDDWALNGDILIWYEPLGRSLELSSMGIRVSPESLAEQLKLAGAEDRAKLTFHKMLLAGELPYTIGGGIGQSRLCMAMLDKIHIGEVQCSVWPEEMIRICGEKNVFLL